MCYTSLWHALRWRWPKFLEIQNPLQISALKLNNWSITNVRHLQIQSPKTQPPPCGFVSSKVLSDKTANARSSGSIRVNLLQATLFFRPAFAHIWLEACFSSTDCIFSSHAQQALGLCGTMRSLKTKPQEICVQNPRQSSNDTCQQSKMVKKTSTVVSNYLKQHESYVPLKRQSSLCSIKVNMQAFLHFF